MHSAILRRPAPPPFIPVYFLSLTVANHKEDVKPKEKNMSCVTSGSSHIQFDMSKQRLGGDPGRDSEPSIISKSSPAHFRSQTSLEFNNVTLHTAAVNSSKFQGEKVSILNNHAHFSPRSPTPSLMLMPRMTPVWMDVQFSLFLHTIYSKFWT